MCSGVEAAEHEEEAAGGFKNWALEPALQPRSRAMMVASSGATTRAPFGILVRSIPACQRSQVSSVQPKGRPPPKDQVANFRAWPGKGQRGADRPWPSVRGASRAL
ncbi:MAG: hypothetical protein IPK80_01945 [Nannocystis sp.]|nr:hypothetical protein [Nannocystis sp.]